MATVLTPITANIPDFTVTPQINTATFPEDIDQYNSELPAVITAQDLLGTQINILIPQLNTLETNVTNLEANTQFAADIAIAVSNFQGTWTNQPTSIPQSWLYNGVVYMVLIPGTASPVTTPANWYAIGTALATSYDNSVSGLAAMEVQSAIDELQAEKSPIASPTFTGTVTAPTLNVTTVNASTSIIFEGATADAFETTLTVTNPTADRTITLPDASGTVALLDSPSLTGIPTAPTATVETNTTQIATTAGVIARIPVSLNASGSAPMYACRAWVNFNGTGTVAIRASGNVSSITDNGVGDYTVNFITAMQDANYGVSGAANLGSANFMSTVSEYASSGVPSGKTAGGVRVSVNTVTSGPNFNTQDIQSINVAIFR